MALNASLWRNASVSLGDSLQGEPHLKYAAVLRGQREGQAVSQSLLGLLLNTAAAEKAQGQDGRIQRTERETGCSRESVKENREKRVEVPRESENSHAYSVRLFC